ncbi:MAG: radical SAM protein [Deltaproteobacteria bacterium]|nr:radical SAM protein [Deltaproteobacteria bacterium]
MRAPRLLFADPSGQVYDHPELLALVLDPSAPAGAGLARDGHVPLPRNASLSVLPGRKPVGLDPRTGEVVELSEVKLGKRSIKPIAVACVLPPGWTRFALPAFKARAVAPLLPQWAYCAVGFSEKDGHVAWAAHTDRRTHWQPEDRTPDLLRPFVEARLAQDDNPLLKQLARCALEWRCFTAANTFTVRDEGAIPASTMCNARCIGCISDQPPEGPPASHERMDDAPDAQNMAGIGVAHLDDAPGRTMVSFGQGCEGEPLTRGRVIAHAIRLMRQKTSRGSININTNGSLPRMLELLIDAGLDATRISLNSAHAPLYEAYYQPIKYGWAEVHESIVLAKKRGLYTALNLLTFPGVVDTEGEAEALCELVGKAKVDQIQVRSLAIDPAQYLAVAKVHGAGGRPLGMRKLLANLKKARKGLVIGNFARGLEERAPLGA